MFIYERGDCVPFVEWASELRRLARLSLKRTEPKRKRVLIGRQLVVVDPKPGDLSMARVKRW